MPFVNVSGIDLFYETTGSGEPVLLLHGLGSSTQDWERQVPALSERHLVIAYDARGHGRSQKRCGPYGVAVFAADTAALLDALGVGPVHVVGLSMGGMIAFQLLSSRPDLVRSAVIVNSGPEFVLTSRALRFALLQRSLLVRALGMRGWGKLLGRRLFPSPAQASLRATFVERIAGNDKRTYLAVQRSLAGWSVADRLAGMDRPVLVLAGDRDYTPVSFKEEYVARMPRARLSVIAGAGHALPMEKPREFNAALLDFLSRPEPRA
jgi:3-oxoadipate enol-lactonase